MVEWNRSVLIANWHLRSCSCPYRMLEVYFLIWTVLLGLIKFLGLTEFLGLLIRLIVLPKTNILLTLVVILAIRIRFLLILFIIHPKTRWIDTRTINWHVYILTGTILWLEIIECLRSDWRVFFQSNLLTNYPIGLIFMNEIYLVRIKCL